ncbi:UDP-glycosyltransferase 89B2 [Herrania umbratica]|uniref:UDP-glycosyltransferase 89B2 n=1 Tax=Herrania umbratica TaxID=108875 RepID=A0A6J1AGV5_9ROSI|nr:UDP-glycosyltransferase 89B2 [Herrania umbratica]
MAILGRNAHVLVFPYPAQGHMIPLLDLTHHLATASDLTITILVTPKNLPLLTQLLSSHPQIKTLVLPFPPHASIPSDVENCKDLPQGCSTALIHALGQLYHPLLSWFESHPSPPSAIVSDMFLGWTQRLASRLGIKRIVFSPSGATALSVLYSLWLDLPKLDDPQEPTAVISFDKIPKCPKYPWWKISPTYRACVGGDPAGEFIKDGFIANIKSWGLIINSFAELEGPYFDHLKKVMGSDHVWAVGPLHRLHVNNSSSLTCPVSRSGPSSISVDGLLTWLDTCEEGEVVYVCFGSQVVLTNDQMAAVASAMENSGVRFIWCVKEPTEGHVEGKYGMIPNGFEDRVASKGHVIRGWAPQVAILCHRAVGTFLTHCGWNSVLEAVVAGVTMLTWPFGADQFVDDTLLVDEIRVAKRACEGAQTVPNSDELARVVAESVSNKNSLEREGVIQLRKAAVEAIKEGGSSAKDLEELVKHLCSTELDANSDM